MIKVIQKFIIPIFVLTLFSSTGFYWQDKCFNRSKQNLFCRVSGKINLPGRILLSGWNDTIQLIEKTIIFKSLNFKHGHTSKRPLETKKRFKDLKPGFTFNYPAGSRNTAGYLLLSRFSPQENGDPKIELWDLNNQRMIKDFKIDFESIRKGTNLPDLAEVWGAPLLTEDGSLLLVRVGGSYGSIVKVNSCGKYVEHNSENGYHHSIEIDSDGKIYSPINEATSSLNKDLHSVDFKDDGFAILDSNLKVIRKYSLIDIYTKAGLLADIYGGDNYSYDPFHLNDVQPFVRPDGSSLVLLSVRNQSSIIAFDIEEEKIIWKIERATMNQHDVDILNTKNNLLEISIFDNHTVNYFDKKSFGNKIVTFKNLPTELDDELLLIANNKAHEKYKINKLSYKNLGPIYEPRTITSGISDIVLENNSVMLEESNYGRLIEVDNKDGSILWQYVNKLSKNSAPFLLNRSRRIYKLSSKISQKIHFKCSSK